MILGMVVAKIMIVPAMVILVIPNGDPVSNADTVVLVMAIAMVMMTVTTPTDD